ncbi:MAG: 4-oxalocrotonate tautomerase family protein [Candidatus Cloacimonetes bacterium]|nr:4-oxalocrotonate tautomerase family protein [Candidatus Cloacimonadota bacterium]
MPVLTVENAGSLTRDQKLRLITELTKVIADITGKSEAAVYIRIDEVPRENFGVGGKPLG